MENSDIKSLLGTAEAELYTEYLGEQLRSWRWRWRKQRLLLTVEPETLAERAALVEYLYEFSLTHRLNPYKAVDRISDIFEDGRSQAGGTEETRELAQSYHVAHSAYWLQKTKHRFLRNWSNGLGLGAVLAIIDILVRGTRLLNRPYSLSFMSIMALVVLLVAFPLIFAWLSTPGLSSEERIVGWRIL